MVRRLPRPARHNLASALTARFAGGRRPSGGEPALFIQVPGRPEAGHAPALGRGPFPGDRLQIFTPDPLNSGGSIDEASLSLFRLHHLSFKSEEHKVPVALSHHHSASSGPLSRGISDAYCHAESLKCFQFFISRSHPGCKTSPNRGGRAAVRRLAPSYVPVRPSCAPMSDGRLCWPTRTFSSFSPSSEFYFHQNPASARIGHPRSNADNL